MFSLIGCGKKQPVSRPNIILIILDTTRADRLSCYGYERKTSPNIDKLAGESVLYSRAIAPSSWTLPSHASLFTGKFTTSHGAKYDPEGPLDLTDAIDDKDEEKEYRARGLSQNELTLASILKEAGYMTAAVVGGPWLKRVFGLAKGFDHYDDTQINTLDGINADQVTDSAARWLDKSYKKKFFLFLNYFDPHAPYSPPDEFVEKLLPDGILLSKDRPQLGIYNALYDAEILFMDYHVGRLFQKLKDCGVYDSSWIIVTADHGELLGEHGQSGHGSYLYQEEIHIPLLFKYPAKEASPGRTDTMVQLNDVFAMILNRLGIALPENIQAGLPPRIGHPVLSETYPLNAEDGHWRAIIEDDFKFLWNSKGKHQLFHLGGGRAEDVNLVEREAQRAEMMLAKMDTYLARLPKPGPAGPEQQLDEKTKEALKSLGYVK
jgi:arylsulfatase A-like enzyme